MFTDKHPPSKGRSANNLFSSRFEGATRPCGNQQESAGEHDNNIDRRNFLQARHAPRFGFLLLHYPKPRTLIGCQCLKLISVHIRNAGLMPGTSIPVSIVIMISWMAYAASPLLMVLCCHHIYVNPRSGPMTLFIGALIGEGARGIILFFAISGFLISWPFWRRKFANADKTAPSGYAKRRFWKIYPPLALSIFLLTPVYLLLSHDGTYISIAAKWLAGVPFLLPVSGKLNPVMWTLVIEVQFYLVLPLVFLIFKNVSPKVCLWIIPLIFLLIPVTFRSFTGLNPEFSPDINSHFPSALDAFCLGILVASLDNQGGLEAKWALLGIAGIVLLFFGLLLEAWKQTHSELQGSTTGVILPWIDKIGSGFLLCYVANPKHPMARLLCAPSLRWCGIISYEWYLFHQPVIQWARQIFGPAGGNILFYVALVGGSLLLSGLFPR